MKIFVQKSASFLVTLGIFSVLAACLFGTSSVFSMEMDAVGKMDGCIFTGETALCNMSVTEHISQWQNLFTAIPHKAVELLLALSLAMAAFLLIGHRPHLQDKLRYAKERLYIKLRPALNIVNPLELALSRGILNPKIYNPVIS